jgi:hypothetical protein
MTFSGFSDFQWPGQVVQQNPKFVTTQAGRAAARLAVGMPLYSSTF